MTLELYPRSRWLEGTPEDGGCGTGIAVAGWKGSGGGWKLHWSQESGEPVF